MPRKTVAAGPYRPTRTGASMRPRPDAAENKGPLGTEDVARLWLQ